jgi:hypothetical protein
MSEIELTGLRADVPLGAMAAFGCLRVCERVPAFRGSRLAWAAGGGADHAVLFAPGECGREMLVPALAEDVRLAGGRGELTWHEQIKTASAEEFRREAGKAIEASTGQDREPADWFAAFGSEIVRDKEGKLEPTPFDMTVARQKFLADALRLANGLAENKRKSAVDCYEEALFDPWKYEDDQHSLGWDPTTLKMGAFTYKAPTAMANAGVRAAVWLAFESLPLFPCFYDGGGLEVRAFRRQRREYVFYWPVWRAPIGLDELRPLLDRVAGADAEELAGRGVAALYRSERYKPNKYLFSFRSPELVFTGTENAGAA